MGSRWVEKKQTTGKKGILKGANKPLYAWFQFVPARVTTVILHKGDIGYTGRRDVNAVLASPHINDAFSTISQTEAFDEMKYFPLLRGIQDVPTKGDQVLVCTFGGINYYLGPLNTINSPNFNPDFLSFDKKRIDLGIGEEAESTRTSFGLPGNFPIKNVYRAQRPYNKDLDGDVVSDLHGDLNIEGRHGNNIRIGSRASDPYIFISNGRTSPHESWYDPSLITMTNIGTINQHLVSVSADWPEFILSCDRNENNERLVGASNEDSQEDKGLYDYNYDLPQLYLHSKKITIDSGVESMFLSSYKDIVFGAANDTIFKSNKIFEIDAEEIILGNRDREFEPLVLGERLDEILEDIVSILETMKVTGTVGGISGPPAPDVFTKIANLKVKLQENKHLSQYHTIEKNSR